MLFNSILTASLTIIGGVIIFVAGQIIVRFVIQPIEELKKTIGEVADLLIYYANWYSGGPWLPEKQDIAETAKSALRQKASQLRGRANVVPCYAIFSRLSLLPTRGNIIKASDCMIGIVNSLDGTHGRENKGRRKEIVEALGLWLYDEAATSSSSATTERGTKMAKYSIHVFCNECSEVHPMGITVNLDDGPADRKSVGDTYAGKPLPPEVARLSDNLVTCPKTGKGFTQKDNHQVFLVPVG